MPRSAYSKRDRSDREMVVPEPEDLGVEKICFYDSLLSGKRGNFWSFSPNDLYVVTDPDAKVGEYFKDEFGEIWLIHNVWPEGGYIFY